MTDLLDHCIHKHDQSRSKIEAFSVVKGCEGGVTLTERNIHIDLSRYDHLNIGETDSIVLSYKVVSEFGLELPKVACFFVEGTENQPKLWGCSFEVEKKQSSNVSVQLA